MAGVRKIAGDLRTAARLVRAGPPLNRSEDLSPVMIIGAGRSGNTLLRRLLMTDPELYIPPETYVLGELTKGFGMVARLPWRVVCTQVIGAFATSEDFETFPQGALRPAFKAMLALAEEERSLAAVLDILYRHFAAQVKPTATRWGDKTPLNTLSLDALAGTFPRARYVHIHRDGFDVVASYCKMGRYAVPEEAARRWVDATRACEDFSMRNPGQVHRLSYEDLVRDPEPQMERVFAHVGLTYTAGQLDRPVSPDVLGDVDVRAHYTGVADGISTASIGKGRASLDPDVKTRVDKIIAAQMTRLGYA